MSAVFSERNVESLLVELDDLQEVSLSELARADSDEGMARSFNSSLPPAVRSFNSSLPPGRG